MIEERFKKVSESRTFRNIISVHNLSSKKILDLGCGFGEYLAHFGRGSVGLTTTKEEVEYGKDSGLDIRFGNVEDIDKFFTDLDIQGVWANNLFEHLISPHSFLIKLKKVLDGNSILILGVPVVPFPSFLLKFSLFRGALASNHINFFTKKTLRLTAEFAGWKVMTVRPFFFKSSFLDFLFSLFAPHQYLIASNDTNFKYPPKKLKEWIDDSKYDDLLKITNQK